MQDDYFNDKTLKKVRDKLQNDLLPQHRKWLEAEENQIIVQMERDSDPALAIQVKAWRDAGAIDKRKRDSLQDIQTAKEKRTNAIIGIGIVTIVGVVSFFINAALGIVILIGGLYMMFLNMLPDVK